MAVKGKKAEPNRRKKTAPDKTVSINDTEKNLLEVPKEPSSLVQNGAFSASFVRPRFEIIKEQNVVGFDLSFNLDDVLQSLVPKQVLPRWREVQAGGVKRLDMTDIPPQVIHIALFPEDDKPAGSEVILDGAIIMRARIEEIVSKGDGKEDRNVRFSFTAYVKQDAELIKFAAWKHDNIVWLKMSKKQGELAFDPEEGAEG